jgi:hypothetical protein
MGCVRAWSPALAWPGWVGSRIPIQVDDGRERERETNAARSGDDGWRVIGGGLWKRCPTWYRRWCFMASWGGMARGHGRGCKLLGFPNFSVELYAHANEGGAAVSVLRGPGMA